MKIEDEDGKYNYYADIYVIRDLFSKVEIGETITFAQIEEVMKKPVDGSVYAAIHQAKILLESEDRMVFGNVRSVGYKRLTDSEIIESFELDRRRLRRRAQRAARRLTNINDYASLSNVQKITHQAGLGVLAAISRVAMPRTVEDVKKSVATLEAPTKSTHAPIGKILDIMRGNVKD
jgi:hypothetical protein